MKLSDVVAYLNLLDSLDVSSECDVAIGSLKNINHVVAQHADKFDSASEDIGRSFDAVEQSESVL